MNKTNSVYYRSYLEKVKEDIAAGKTHRIMAKSNSMRPFIVAWRDEFTLKQTNGDSFKKGAILLAELGGQSHVVQRLVRVDGDDLVLRGDGKMRGSKMCGRNDIVAEVVSVKRKGRVVKKGSFYWNCYRFFWPSSSILRRILLNFYFF